MPEKGDIALPDSLLTCLPIVEAADARLARAPALIS